MFVSKVSIWAIYFFCVINFSFSSSKSKNENSLLFKNYSENIHERCQQSYPHVMFAQERDITPAIDHKEIIQWNPANEVGSTQENENKMLENVQASARGFPSTQKNNMKEKQNFFVITAIFNPVSYKSRYNLYHQFAKHMNDTGAQLITIECIFPSLNQTKFQVTKSNNSWHIQLKSESVYWMKENLISIAVSRLPTHAKWASWLDADIEFEEKNWVELTIQELKNYLVVQIFELAKFLGPSPKKEFLQDIYSFGYGVIRTSFNGITNGTWFPHPGYGWAMSVNNFRVIHGLPDYDIVGSGDRFFAYSLLNKISHSFMSAERKLLPSPFLHLILDVANQTFKTLQEISKSNYKAIVGYVPLTIRHYWHGSVENRQYRDRCKILIDNNFDFKTDVSLNEDGLLQLTKTKPKLQKDLLALFQGRHEDWIQLSCPCRYHTM